MEVTTEAARPEPARLARARRKFLRLFPGGFRDETYDAWEREYKWQAHLEWQEALGREEWRRMLARGRFEEIAARAVRIESRTNLLFSFEKMAIRDAVKTRDGARAFAEGLYDFLYGRGELARRFDRYVETFSSLPRRQTRVATWPALTVFPFLANPDEHLFLKPLTTKRAAESLGVPFEYSSRPAWPTYASLLALATSVERALADLGPRDMIDVQGFLWVLGSDEYA